MEEIAKRRKEVIQLKKDWSRRGVKDVDGQNAINYLSEQLATEDGLEKMLVIQDEKELLRMLDALSAALLFAIKNQRLSLLHYYDRVFILCYESYVYRRSLTHPLMLKTLNVVREEK